MNRNTPSAHIAGPPGGPNTNQKIKKQTTKCTHEKKKKEKGTKIKALTANQKKKNILYIANI